jgi:SH3-like domain-containing protein
LAAISGECLLLFILCTASAQAGRPPAKSAQPEATQLRYATLRAAPVNARGGPGEDYKALWTYQAKGVPVQIVEVSEDWRRICDPEGGLAWVRARTLDNRRTVMRIVPSDLPMRRGPSADAKIGAVLAARATAALMGCKAGWCRIGVDHTTGWARAGDLWGAGDGPQCK